MDIKIYFLYFGFYFLEYKNLSFYHLGLYNLCTMKLNLQNKTKNETLIRNHCNNYLATQPTLCEQPLAATMHSTNVQSVKCSKETQYCPHLTIYFRKGKVVIWNCMECRFKIWRCRMQPLLCIYKRKGLTSRPIYKRLKWNIWNEWHFVKENIRQILMSYTE